MEHKALRLATSGWRSGPSGPRQPHCELARFSATGPKGLMLLARNAAINGRSSTVLPWVLSLVFWNWILESRAGLVYAIDANRSCLKRA
jgi:hypothetical protein